MGFKVHSYYTAIGLRCQYIDYFLLKVTAASQHFKLGPPKNCLLVLARPTVLSGPTAKVADAMDTTGACTFVIEVKHGPKSLINIISTFEMKMMLSEVFDVVSKDLQEVLVQVQVSAKEEGLWRDVPPSEKLSSLSNFQIRYICFWVRYECVYVVRVFYMQNVGSHRTFKNNYKKTKTFPDRPILPREGHLWTSKLFFSWP